MQSKLGRDVSNRLADRSQVTPYALVLGTLTVFALGLYFVGASFIASGLNAVEARAFSQINLLLVFGLPLIGAVYAAVLFKGHFKLAIAATVVSFGLLGKATRIGGIPAYNNGEGYTQYIALTHAMIFALAFALIVNRAPVASPFQRKVLFGLSGFAIIGTISQLFNHSFPSSILLSIGSLWVYVALVYTIFAIFTGEKGLRELASIIVASLFFGVIIRLATTGEGFFVINQDNDLFRIGGFAFGPSVSYAGYLAVAAVFSIALTMYESSTIRRIAFAFIALVLVVEVTSTGTRGAMLSLILIPIGIAATRRYRLSAAMFGFLGLATIILWPKISQVLDSRPIYFDGRVNTIPQWMERAELWKLNLPHVLDNFGLGHGMGNQLNLIISTGVPTPSHNTFLDLTQQVGAIATFVLIGVIFAIVYRGIKQALLTSNVRSRTMAMLGLTAFGSWFFTANTTSTSLVWFYPVEGSAIFYTTLAAITLIKSGPTPSRGTQ
jgi:O-antigen ligase